MSFPFKTFILLTLFSAGAYAKAEELDALFTPVQNMMVPKFRNTKEKEDYVFKVMQRTQDAAERYASHHKGMLPKQVDNAFMSYMIFGECDDKTFNTFSIPFNPFLGRRKAILNGKISDPQICRTSSPGLLTPGAVEYSIASSGKNFTVRGGGADGRALRSPNNKRYTFVLSHDPEALVKANMRTVQWAAEKYKEDHHNYPKFVDDNFKYYFPSGDPEKKRLGFALPNPYSGKLEWPVVTELSSAMVERVHSPASVAPGRIEYCSVREQTNYAIRAGNDKKKAIAGTKGPSSTLVLGKDGDGYGIGGSRSSN